MADEIHLLIEKIYEAGLMPSLWPQVLDKIATHCAARGGLLMVRSGEWENWTSSAALVPVMGEFMQGGWAKHNLRAARCRAASSHPGFLTDSDLMSPRELETLPIYKNFLRPRGLSAGAGTSIQGIKMDGLMLTVEGFPTHSDSRNSLAILNVLRPHLARAAAISAQMKLQQAAAVTTALELIGTAAAVVEKDARVISANAAFHHHLGSLLTCRGNRLACDDPISNRDFHEALYSTTQGLGRSIAVKGSRQVRAVIHFLPVARTAQDVFHSASVLVVVDIPATSNVLSINLIRSLYDLTMAEAKVAHQVAGGSSPAETAAALGVSIETVRTHLKRVFSKTGAARQSTLALRLRCSTPPGV